jgi:hypothetical protein
MQLGQHFVATAQWLGALACSSGAKRRGAVGYPPRSYGMHGAASEFAHDSP